VEASLLPPASLLPLPALPNEWCSWSMISRDESVGETSVGDTLEGDCITRGEVGCVPLLIISTDAVWVGVDVR